MTTWYDAKKAHPAQSGKVIVIMVEDMSIMTVQYSAKHQAFNAYDYMEENRNSFPVDFWAYPEDVLPKEVIERKEWGESDPF